MSGEFNLGLVQEDLQYLSFLGIVTAYTFIAIAGRTLATYDSTRAQEDSSIENEIRS